VVVVLWFVFSGIIINLIPGALIYILLFPVGSIIYYGVEHLVFNYIFKTKLKTKITDEKCFIDFPAGVTAVSLFLCVILAKNLVEAVIMSFGFTSGIFLINLIIREINRRASLEAIPVFLRGKPLVLIAMGMLSLVFITATLLIFRIINTG
jgi:hypothetical protein